MIRMYRSDHRFPLRSRVRLKSGVDTSIYGDYACVGNEGVITDRRKDKFDLPEVFIEWDRNHWSWNGVTNGWTFEEHFELVEDTMSKQDKLEQFGQMLAQGLASLMNEGESTTKAEEPKEEKPGVSLKNLFESAAQSMRQESDEDSKWQRLAEALGHKIGESEAFMVITIERHPSTHAPEGALMPGFYAEARSPESEILIGAHMASAASRAHQELVVRHLETTRTSES